MDGSCRVIESVTGRKEPSTALWCPVVPEDGDYAVYVSYRTFPNSVDDARYIVRHQGIDTPFTVNQQMGGGTWVYLERPTETENIVLRPFNGCCQLLLRSVEGASGTAELIIAGQSYPIPYLR